MRLAGVPAIEEESQFVGEDMEFVQEMFDLSEVIFESEDSKELKSAEDRLLALEKEYSSTVNTLFREGRLSEVKPHLAKLSVVEKKLGLIAARKEKETQS